MIGLQNALNKTWLDLIAAADTNGFPLLAIEYNGEGGFGSIQDDADIEGNDEFRLSPGRAIEVDNATVHRLEASNLQPMIDTMWTIVQAVAGVSRTPAYYLRPEVDPLSIQTVWTDANVRNELAQAQVGQAYQGLGVPDDTIWQYVLGFTPSEIAGWKADKRREEAVKIASVSESLRRAQLQAQRPTDTTSTRNESSNGQVS